MLGVGVLSGLFVGGLRAGGGRAIGSDRVGSVGKSSVCVIRCGVVLLGKRVISSSVS